MLGPDGIKKALTLCNALRPLKEFLNRAIRYDG